MWRLWFSSNLWKDEGCCAIKWCSQFVSFDNKKFLSVLTWKWRLVELYSSLFLFYLKTVFCLKLKYCHWETFEELNTSNYVKLVLASDGLIQCCQKLNFKKALQILLVHDQNVANLQTWFYNKNAFMTKAAFEKLHSHTNLGFYDKVIRVFKNKLTYR